MEDIKIINEVMPVIEMNFTEVKTALEETLTKYNGMVVTEQTLSGCKATQKELASVRVKIDTYRKDKKKALSEPITAFENQCKELIALVEKAEQPIKDGIKVFDDKKRADKKAVAELMISEVIAEQGLNVKYAARLDVLEKYCNLTAKESEVKNDLEQRAFVLLAEQNREAELLDIIKDCINTENERINTKLKIEDFQRLINSSVATKEILAEVKQRAERTYLVENPPKVEPKEEPKEEPKQEIPQAGPKTIAEPVSETVVEEPTYYATYRITGKLAELQGVSNYLKQNGITYGVTEQGEI